MTLMLHRNLVPSSSSPALSLSVSCITGRMDMTAMDDGLGPKSRDAKIPSLYHGSIKFSWLVPYQQNASESCSSGILDLDVSVLYFLFLSFSLIILADLGPVNMKSV
ncbi:hypothetical protein Ancab_029020 [Ancistrocladus abbreviatus]